MAVSWFYFAPFHLECVCWPAWLLVVLWYSSLQKSFLRNMDDVDTSISQMNKESLHNRLKEKFNDDTAAKFEGKSYWNTKLNFNAK